METMKDLPEIDRTWTLFLDRDGVINHEKRESYVLHPGEFRFYDQVTGAIKTLSEIFGTIVVVTNQKGVGKGLMTEDDLASIHGQMLTAIIEAGGRIDKIYYCDSLDNDCYDRKPNPGMAVQAKKDFDRIDFKKSIMVGNKLTDMQFGRNAGMYTVFVNTTDPEVPSNSPLIDFRFDDLPAFAAHVAAVIRKP
jgi:D-glycero-D-manno-heptose 1,7-bisphosphate phosphatase